jgi:hypothetical protein
VRVVEDGVAVILHQVRDDARLEKLGPAPAEAPNRLVEGLARLEVTPVGPSLQLSEALVHAPSTARGASAVGGLFGQEQSGRARSALDTPQNYLE